MSSPAVETTGMHPLATRRELRPQRRERKLLAVVTAVVLTALLLAAAFIVDSEHHQVPVSVPPGTIVPLAARTS